MSQSPLRKAACTSDRNELRNQNFQSQGILSEVRGSLYAKEKMSRCRRCLLWLFILQYSPHGIYNYDSGVSRHCSKTSLVNFHTKGLRL